MIPRPRPISVALLAAFGLLQLAAFAQTPLTDEHVDLGVAEGSGLGLHWHDETNAIEHEPQDAFAYIDPVNARVTRPAGGQWDFLGVLAGQDIWVLPQTQNPSLPFLGIGAEDVTLGTFDNWNPGDSRGANTSAPWIRLELTGFSGPGQFSMWQNGAFGSPNVWMSTHSTPVDGDYFYIQEGGHAHVNWGFSELGTYFLTFEATGYIGGSPVTESATFTFSTSLSPIPEPSTYALMAVGTLLVGLSVRRRFRLSRAEKSSTGA